MPPHAFNLAAITAVQVASRNSADMPVRTRVEGWVTSTTPSVTEPTTFGQEINKARSEQVPYRTVSSPIGEAAGSRRADSKTQRAFEAVTLQVLVGSMLPNESNKMFGTGSAGKMWKSLFAEKLAMAIATSGRLKLLPDNALAAISKSGKIAPDPRNALVVQRSDTAGVKPPSAWTTTVAPSTASDAIKWLGGAGSQKTGRID